MSDIAIRVVGLGKLYKIGKLQRYDTLRDHLSDLVRRRSKRNGNRLTQAADANPTELWALRDVSFEVKRGEVVGIIGRNGAGKSTLLKVLSRITEPTEGYADIVGRVGSLLEVGTGFHPELTGRDNIYLNGSILGMKRAEIQKKFDQIVDFAEVEKFIDTPVKHYSSGMYVRLAFAVAAHLDPEILVVDEVLAVGDAAFQRKCLGKMGEVAREGRTVLFVSHNMAAMRRLCETGIYLVDGEVKSIGSIDKVANEYQVAAAARSNDSRSSVHVAEGEAKYVSWKLENSSTASDHTCYSREECEFRLSLTCKRPIKRGRLGLELVDLNDQRLIVAHSSDHGGEEVDLAPGDYEVCWKVRLPLREGIYNLIAGLGSELEGQIDLWEARPSLTILPSVDLHVNSERRGLVSEQISLEVHSLQNPTKELAPQLHDAGVESRW
jgi:lipopolysaccharide transport system ATP-binding protein